MGSANIINLRIALLVLLTFILIAPVGAQSRDQSFPTAVTTNEIGGAIKARDIGDSRVTSFYYVFDGVQGDIFINVVTKNFTGDIDVFSQDGLRPLTKMVIYADAGPAETGRLIYLRKSERLLLRIQGRTPNDDAASFRIKFAGSFVAVAEEMTEDAPTLDPTTRPDGARTVVNSVGTIIEVRPRSKNPEKTTNSRNESSDEVPTIFDKPSRTKVKSSEPVAKESKKETTPAPVAEKRNNSRANKTETKPDTSAANKPVNRPRNSSPPAKAPAKPEEKKPDPLASIQLIILLKNGEVFERPMSEVLKFNVDKGMLVVIEKNGVTTRHSILNVAKVTIE